ncbi:hypothetical protein PIB30_056749 [Stylosanthes scabra]|uniref:Retrotransposon gag domain-containing protein n=1 Tax=Stylosanthes scabra TaxID=79078 RepID=A0ABU6RK44_9FABA|nr:hypothetical protein [Stylosanthes scabra]
MGAWVPETVSQMVYFGRLGVQFCLHISKFYSNWFNNNKYFPPSARNAKELELMQFRQGELFLDEYVRKFEDLCRFSQICKGDPASFES